MITVHRVFAAIIVALAGFWIWAEVLVSHQTAANQAFYAQQLAPAEQASQRQYAAFNKALNERKNGGVTPLPEFEPINQALFDESMERAKQLRHYTSLRATAGFSFLIAVFGWGVVAQVQNLVRRHRWEAPERPTTPGAGKLIGELIRSETVFVAKKPGGSAAPEIQVDGKRRVAVFRRFVFVRSFVGNPTRDFTEVPFADLLVGSMHYAKGRAFLSLRATCGRVTIARQRSALPAVDGTIDRRRRIQSNHARVLSRGPHA
jgi:hypothetical protein